jgi:competence protein ComEC
LTNDLRIRFLDVGQGDAIVGILPGGRRAFVVDVYDSQRVLDFLDSEGITEVVLFLTHSDRDHTAGADELLVALTSDSRPTRVLGIFFSQDRINVRTRSAYRRLVQSVASAGRSLSKSDPGVLNADFNTVLNQIPAFAAIFDPVRVYVAHPAKADQDSLIGVDTNETAGVLLVEYTVAPGVVRRALLTADVQLTGISLMLDRRKILALHADVLKYPHHGAWPIDWPGCGALGPEVQRQTMDDFFRCVMPAIVLFSVGRDNPHGHIRPKVLELLTAYRTECGRLREVRWTQRTAACSQYQKLPLDGPSTDIVDEGDIEIRFGLFPDSDYVHVSQA